MASASPDDPKLARGSTEANSAAKHLAQENLELRKDLEEAHALILKLRAENNRFANERNQAMLERLNASEPAPKPNSTPGPRSPSHNVEVVITSVSKKLDHVPTVRSYQMVGKSSKRPIEVLESSDSDEPQSPNASNTSTAHHSNTNMEKSKHPRILLSPPATADILTTTSNKPAQPNEILARSQAFTSGEGAAAAMDEDYPIMPLEDGPSGHIVNKKEFMEGLKNPKIKVKVKQAAVRLPDDSIYNRLHVLGPPRFALPAHLTYALLSATTTRKELTAQFGGSSYTLLQHISPERTAVHGYKRFLCPMLEMNPHTPQVPGAHGLMFRSGDDDDMFGGGGGGGKVGSQKEIVLVGIGEGKWLYMGDYELQKSDSLSREEYLLVPMKVRNDWASKILSAKSGLRARSRISIFLRKQLRREPSTAEVHAREAAKKKGKKKSKKNMHRSMVESEDEVAEEVAEGLTVEDIKRAYESGEEKLNVWVLKCTGYDEAFQRKLANFKTGINAEGSIPSQSGSKGKQMAKDKVQEEPGSDESDEIIVGRVHTRRSTTKHRSYVESNSDLSDLEYM